MSHRPAGGPRESADTDPPCTGGGFPERLRQSWWNTGGTLERRSQSGLSAGATWERKSQSEWSAGATLERNRQLKVSIGATLDRSDRSPIWHKCIVLLGARVHHTGGQACGRPITLREDMSSDLVTLEAAQAAREAFKDRVSAKVGISLQGWHLSDTAEALIRAGRSLGVDGLGDRLASLDGPEWSRACLADLLPVGLTLYAVNHDLIKAQAQRMVLVPEPLWNESTELYNRMLTVAIHNLYDEPKAQEELQDIRQGSGYQDRSGDLSRLKALYTTHEAKLRLDRRYRATDAADAARVAGEILDAITSGETPEVRRLKAEASSTLALALEIYEEVAAAGRLVLRKSGGEARFPRLRTLSRG